MARLLPLTGQKAMEVSVMTEKEKHVNPIQAQKYLKGVDYPSSKKELVETAKRHGADRNVLDALNGLPERTYEGPTEVTKEMGRHK